jgi:hypothetical protein
MSASGPKTTDIDTTYNKKVNKFRLAPNKIRNANAEEEWEKVNDPTDNDEDNRRDDTNVVNNNKTFDDDSSSSYSENILCYLFYLCLFLRHNGRICSCSYLGAIKI